MIKASRHTLFANIVQQFCAGLLLLFLPNILGKADYAQVVFVMVLLSFVAFADAGMSMAYGRVVPSLLAQNKHDEVKIWDSTTLRFGLAMSCFCSVIMTIIYYHRYGNLINTLLLLPMPFVVFWFSFHVSRFSTFGNFSCYSKVNTWRSIGSLLVFPLAFTFGLTGFFISQLVAALLALASIGKILFKPLGKLHWSLLRHHLLEGVIRSLTGILWINLMNFSRLYASIKYGAEDIATYGIMSSAAQSLLSLVISLFLPVGVELFNRHGKSELHALEFAHHIIRRSIKWTMLASFLAIICAPTALRLCFPSYHFDGRLMGVTLLSIALFPFFTIYGNLMIIRKKFMLYLIFVIIGLLVSSVVAFMIDIYYPVHGAAWGQLIGVMFYALILFYNVSDFADVKLKIFWKEQAKYLSCAFAFDSFIVMALIYWGTL